MCTAICSISLLVVPDANADATIAPALTPAMQ
jgi:hypothetical protein